MVGAGEKEEDDEATLLGGVVDVDATVVAAVAVAAVVDDDVFAREVDEFVADLLTTASLPSSRSKPAEDALFLFRASISFFFDDIESSSLILAAPSCFSAR